MHQRDTTWLADDVLAHDHNLVAAYLTIYRGAHYHLLGDHAHTLTGYATWRLCLARNNTRGPSLDLGDAGPITAQRRAATQLTLRVPAQHVALTIEQRHHINPAVVWTLVREYAAQHTHHGYDNILDTFTYDTAAELLDWAAQALTPTGSDAA